MTVQDSQLMATLGVYIIIILLLLILTLLILILRKQNKSINAIEDAADAISTVTNNVYRLETELADNSKISHDKLNVLDSRQLSIKDMILDIGKNIIVYKDETIKVLSDAAKRLNVPSNQRRRGGKTNTPKH